MCNQLTFNITLIPVTSTGPQVTSIIIFINMIILVHTILIITLAIIIFMAKEVWAIMGYRAVCDGGDNDHY